MVRSVTELDSLVIDKIKLLLAFLVVMLHCAGATSLDGGCLNYQNGFYDISRILFSNNLCRIAVPIFFMISGYLFFSEFDKWNFEIYKNKIKKRTKTVLVPYLLWNAITFLIYYLYELLYDFRNGISFMSIVDFFINHGGIRLFVDANQGYPIDYPLWFLRDLYLLFIISPCVLWINRNWVKYVLFLLFLILPCYGIKQEYLMGITFFYLGASLRLNEKPLCHSVDNRYLAIVLILIIISTFLFSNSPFYYLTNGLYIVIGYPFILNIVKCLKDKLPTQTAGCAFFIYATHSILLLPYIRQYVDILGGGNSVALALLYILSAVFTFLLFLSIYKLVHFLFPSITNYLTGGR